jgi:hypothetical protein
MARTTIVGIFTEQVLILSKIYYPVLVITVKKCRQILLQRKTV